MGGKFQEDMIEIGLGRGLRTLPISVPMSQVYSDFPQNTWDPQHPFNPQGYFPPHDHRLSLNIDSLSVQSPASLSPTNPSPHPFATHIHQSPFQYDPPPQDSPTGHYDDHSLVPPGSAASSFDRRSRSSSSSSLPRKRSFPSNASSTSLSTTLVEESSYDDSRDAAMDLGSYDDLAPYGSSTNGGTSPVDGSGNTSGAEDALSASSQPQLGLGGGVGGSMNVLGKPMPTNNFVTKLYQCVCQFPCQNFAWPNLVLQDDKRYKVCALYRLDRARHIFRRI